MDTVIRVLPDPVSLIQQILATLVLYVILKKKLFGPITKFLKERQDKIEANINEAKETRNEAINLKRDYEIKIAEAKEEAKSIVEAARKRGEEVREEIVKDAKKEANSIADKANKEIEREKAKAKDDLKKEVVNIAMMVASKVISKEIDENTHKEMISNFIDEVGGSSWQN